jgi:undecaprenyl-diphosphatase
MLAKAITLDYRVMRSVNRWRAPKWVRWWILASTRAGDGWLWAAFGAVLLASGDYLAVVAAALAVAAGILCFCCIKKAVGRERPCHIEPHCWASLLPPGRFSFPSGHSITAFAVAVALGSCHPALLKGLIACALCVAASRVLLGMHFLTDVVAGSALGAALGYASWTLVRQASASLLKSHQDLFGGLALFLALILIHAIAFAGAAAAVHRLALALVPPDHAFRAVEA